MSYNKLMEVGNGRIEKEDSFLPRCRSGRSILINSNIVIKRYRMYETYVFIFNFWLR